MVFSKIKGFFEFSKSLNSLKIIIPFLGIISIFVLQYLLFLNYIVDDAGIVFASSRVLIDYGRLSIDQFTERVEAYSCPLWMIILAGIYLIGLDIIIGAKILNFIFGVLTLCLTFILNKNYGKQIPDRNNWINLISALSLSLMTGFTLWGSAGLENSLYAFLIVGLMLGIMKYDETSSISLLLFFSFLLSLTRPEGILYVVTIHLSLICRKKLLKRHGYKKVIVSLSLFLIFYFTFLCLRFLLFGTIFPNTFYAKLVSDNIPILVRITSGVFYFARFCLNYLSLLFIFLIYSIIMIKAKKDFEIHPNRMKHHKLLLLSLVISIFPFSLFFLYLANSTLTYYQYQISLQLYVITFEIVFEIILIILSISLAVLIIYKKSFISSLIIKIKTILNYIFSNKLVFFSETIILANFFYVLFVGDTWGTTRFLTPSIIALGLILPENLKESFKLNNNSWNWRRISIKNRKISSKLILIPIMLIFTSQMIINTYIEYNNPIWPFEDIKKHADWGNEVGGYLIYNEYLPNAKHITYLVPDIGATSYYSQNYTIIDSAGLANVPIARNGYESSFFKSYIFSQINPVLIETHESWSLKTSIGSYEEFHSKYALVKGVGQINYLGELVSKGYYIKKNIFVLKDEIIEQNSKDYLILNDFRLNSEKYSNEGIIELTIFWQLGNDSIPDEILNNHETTLVLIGNDLNYTIDNRKIIGGYFSPSKWDKSSIIADKRVISLNNYKIQDGHYKLILKISFMDGKTIIYNLHNINVTSNYQEDLEQLIFQFTDILNRNNSLSVERILDGIRAVNSTQYIKYRDLFINYTYFSANELIMNEMAWEAYQKILPFVGTKTDNIVLNKYMGEIESKLSDLFQEKGYYAETIGNISDAINLYESAIWLNPMKSHLRVHVESLRGKFN